MAKAKKRAVPKVKTKKAPARKPAAKTTKRAVSKVKTKKAPARKPVAKTKRKASNKSVSINTLKSLLTQMEKAPAQAIAGAKKLLKDPHKQTQQLLSHYKKQAQQVSKQWSVAQKKLSAAEAKLAKQATAASKNAVKSAQKAYEAAVKKAEQLNKEYDIAHTVSHQVKSLGSKFDYLAKEVVKAANSWIAPAAKPAKKAVITKKPVAKKPAVKKAAKPKAVTVTPAAAPKAPLYKAPPMVAKPIVPATPSIPSQIQKPMTPAPVRNPFTSTPITPQNIAQKPLAGGVNSNTTQQQPKPDAGQNKPFNFNKDDF